LRVRIGRQQWIASSSDAFTPAVNGGILSLFEDSLGDETLVVVGQWEQNQIVLYHNHLPKLDDQGFIQWDPETKMIERGERFDEIRPVLETVSADDDNNLDFPTSLVLPY
jgi:hypothetical protein